ncbi:hypothetical protein HDF16_005207 [Granulicella aggregans]|uniref:Uncharacterized protein n=1 Tax=Granulicella aggregans TaxID=474949 RepID=A0A7W7ZIH8_9BACT|nr:hypothetical protein [Granulicella aggregans]MBB5060471.1 hypothetical protein [Granulicella aggregans]
MTKIETRRVDATTWRQTKLDIDSTMKATRAAWPDGSATSGFAGQVYLYLVRNYMRLLDEIYDLNISQ